jgi:phospholipid/cholesterol/gamma-HCH transport system substrate-binding protein
MYSRVNYAIVGLFVVLFGAGLVAFTFWLAKYGMHSEYTLYKLEMKESISGLSKDSTVRLRGVDVGHVAEIRIDPQNVEQIEVLVKIDSDVPIKEDMKAHTEMLGITGLLAIEIDGGSNAAKLLKAENGQIPVIKTQPSWFSKTSKGLGNMAEDLEKVLDKANSLLSDKNIENFSKTLEHIEKITARGEEIEDKAIESLREFDQRMKEYNASIALITQDFSSIKTVSIPAIDKLYQTSKNFNRLTLKVEKSLDRGDYDMRTILGPMMVEINMLSEQVNDIAKEFKESPSDIFFKSRKQRRGPGE